MIAAGFVDAGARVYISSRKAEVCDEVAAELSSRGECISLPADLSTEDGCRGLAERLAEREARLDILVNNAGATWGAPIESSTRRPGSGCWPSTSRACSTSPSSSSRCSGRRATPEEPARVINIGSIDGIRVPQLETYSYSASKAAVHQLTRHLAKRLAPAITVNAIAPGPFESKMMAATLEAFGEQIAAAGPAPPDRAARRHGRHCHLPRLAGRRLPDRGHHPGRRRDRHRGGVTNH